MRGPQNVFVAQMRSTCSARVGPTEAFLMSEILRQTKSKLMDVASQAFSAAEACRILLKLFCAHNFGPAAQSGSVYNFSCNFFFLPRRPMRRNTGNDFVRGRTITGKNKVRELGRTAGGLWGQ